MSLWLIITLSVIGYLSLGTVILMMGFIDKINGTPELIAWYLLYVPILAICTVATPFLVIIGLITELIKWIKSRRNKRIAKEIEPTNQASEQGSEPL